jgi:uncharacterized membrane protein
MELLPEWAPNVHPMIVHFPIALLLAAIGADVLALVVRRWDWLQPATVALYVAGGASAVATYFTGTWAANTVSVPAAAEPVLTEHANLGWWTMWFFGVYVLVRLGLSLWTPSQHRTGIQSLLLVAALGGGYLLVETGDHGAEMVFRYGVGVQRAETPTRVAEPGLTIGTGGWQWRPQSDTAWTGRVTWLQGGPSDVRAILDTTSTGAVALTLTPSAPITFVVPDPLGAVQVTAELNVDDFAGTVSILHHVQSRETYDLLSIEGSTLRQGRMTSGEATTFATGTAKLDGWHTIRATGDGTHFRGYVDGQMVVHGHGDAANPGTVGLHLNGTGHVQIRSLRVRSL